ncbi:unnamed protein product [Dicrocoelium dendriticum]|nr:unnamed protein product [Dicrocoelium dendriticum]
MLTKAKRLSVKVIAADLELQLIVNPSITGMQLFYQVCETVGIKEIWYFGLEFTNNSKFSVWLDLLKCIKKQIDTSDELIQFTLKAKYFPEDVTTELIHEVTQRFFYLQVKESILSGEILCSFETAALLASYVCQIKYGKFDYAKMRRGFLKNEQLLPKKMQLERPHEQIEAAVVFWYKQHADMPKCEAMLEYLQIAQELEMFGVTYFSVKDEIGTLMLLGVDAFGLNVYPADNRLTPTLGFPWSEVSSVSFKKLKFVIRPMNKIGRTHCYYSESVKNNQLLLSLCVGTHELYIRRRKQETVGMRHLRAQANAEKAVKIGERETLCSAVQARKAADERLKILESKVLYTTAIKNKLGRSAVELLKRVKQLEQQLENEVGRRKRLEVIFTSELDSGGYKTVNTVSEESERRPFQRKVTCNQNTIGEQKSHAGQACIPIGEQNVTLIKSPQNMYIKRYDSSQHSVEKDAGSDHRTEKHDAAASSKMNAVLGSDVEYEETSLVPDEKAGIHVQEYWTGVSNELTTATSYQSDGNSNSENSRKLVVVKAVRSGWKTEELSGPNGGETADLHPVNILPKLCGSHVQSISDSNQPCDSRCAHEKDRLSTSDRTGASPPNVAMKKLWYRRQRKLMSGLYRQDKTETTLMNCCNPHPGCYPREIKVYRNPDGSSSRSTTRIRRWNERFQSLRMIRHGNTKRRADEFESM